MLTRVAVSGVLAKEDQFSKNMITIKICSGWIDRSGYAIDTHVNLKVALDAAWRIQEVWTVRFPLEALWLITAAQLT